MTVAEMHILFKVFLDKIDSEAYPEILPEEIDIFLNEAQDRFIKTRYNINNIYRKGFEESQKRIDDLRNLVITRYTDLSPVTYYTDINVVRADLNQLFEDEALSIPVTEQYMFFLKGMAHVVITDCGDEWRRVKLIQQDDIAAISTDPFNRPLRGKPLMFFEDGDVFIWHSQDSVIDGFLLTFLKRPRQINYSSSTNQQIVLTVNTAGVNTSVNLFDGTTADTISITGAGLTTTQIAQAIVTAVGLTGLSFVSITSTSNRVTIETVPQASYTIVQNLSGVVLPASGDCELSEHTHREIVQMAVEIALENIESQRVQTQNPVNVKQSE